MAFVALILMFSLAGIPPTVGFYAKLAVLQSVVNADMVWLAVLAVLAVAGRRVLLPAHRQDHVLRRAGRHQRLLPAPVRARLMAVNGALVLLLGVLPSPLMTPARGHAPGPDLIRLSRPTAAEQQLSHGRWSTRAAS
jgi:NADH-quinone oxidoreductase subunit N